jgi:hypothetical protein
MYFDLNGINLAINTVYVSVCMKLMLRVYGILCFVILYFYINSLKYWQVCMDIHMLCYVTKGIQNQLFLLHTFCVSNVFHSCQFKTIWFNGKIGLKLVH